MQSTDRTKRLAWVALGVVALSALVALGVHRQGTAADHRDSTALENDAAADIADVFTFRSPTDPNNVVLAMTVPGLIPPAESRFFDPNVLYQFKIDTDGDAVEDLVVQAFATGSGSDQTIHFRGPARPQQTGATNTVLEGEDAATVAFSARGELEVGEGNGLRVFAGLRDDPFFFDLGRFNEIVAGNETSFRDPGVDTFAGTNALALVVELPRAMLGTQLGVWGTTSR